MSLYNSENSLGSCSTIVSSTKSIVNPRTGIRIASSSASITSIANLLANEDKSKLKRW